MCSTYPEAELSILIVHMQENCSSRKRKATQVCEEYSRNEVRHFKYTRERFLKIEKSCRGEDKNKNKNGEAQIIKKLHVIDEMDGCVRTSRRICLHR